jgi:hypothetical protein
LGGDLAELADDELEEEMKGALQAQQGGQKPQRAEGVCVCVSPFH